MNDPYRGISDGHQSGYRRQYAGDRYLAVELEINQLLVTGVPGSWQALQRDIGASLLEALAGGA
jgi:hypothetical protein